MPGSTTIPKTRRILSLWFPRLAAERVVRCEPGLSEAALVVVREAGNMRSVAALTHVAEAAGIRRGQPLSEALALCPTLITRPEDALGAAAFLSALRRWAGKFSPWVAEEAPEGLMIDLTGCAHLFGGEEPLLAQVEADCTDLGLSVRAGIADTAGAAWALARFSDGVGLRAGRSGDAIDQEARATRSRAGRRHWTKGGTAPQPSVAHRAQGRIAAPGTTRQAIGPLPVSALRLPEETVTALARLGLRRIDALLGMPRAGLARRFGADLMRRLDQALGVEPEPISPAGAPLHFAMRLSLPEPIGLLDDLVAGLDRLLPPLCDKLRDQRRGARRARLELCRVDGGTQTVEIGLARPADRPDQLRALFVMKLDRVEVGFGIDRLRLSAPVTEPLHDVEHKGGWILGAEAEANAKAGHRTSPDQAMADLMARIGARVGLEAITRQHPSDSHIAEKTSKTLAAAWSVSATDWPEPTRERPLILFRPEPLCDAEGPRGPNGPTLPPRFRWRGRVFDTQSAVGPERIAPEWWLDERDWRSGVRDYWRVTTSQGATLWLYYAHGGAQSAGWFAHGDFS